MRRTPSYRPGVNHLISNHRKFSLVTGNCAYCAAAIPLLPSGFGPAQFMEALQFYPPPSPHAAFINELGKCWRLVMPFRCTQLITAEC